MKTIYLATPIDYSPQGESSMDWALNTREVLRKMGFVVFCPILAWDLDMNKLDRPGSGYVQLVNDYSLLTADILVARLSGPTCGVPREIVIADDVNKPIFIVRKDWKYRTVFEWNITARLVSDAGQLFDALLEMEDGYAQEELPF